MWLTRISVSNPALVTVLMAAIVVLGIASYRNLPVEAFPDVAFPVVVVTTAYPGASPEAVEFDVSHRIERAVNTIGGVKELTSRSYEGQSVVIVEFDLAIDPLVAVQEVRERVARLRDELPLDVKEPVITRFDPDDYPVMSVVLTSGTHGQRELTALADQVVSRRLESVHGIGRVSIVGGAAREVLVYLKPAKMEALGVTVEQVVRAIRDENRDVPAGSLVAGATEWQVQVRGRAEATREFGDMLVASRNGSPIPLWQVADVRDGEAERESAALIDGRRAVAVDIVKAQGANTLEVVDAARRGVDELRAELPPGVQLEIVRDTSQAIRNSIADVRRTIVEGGILTILIVFLFLGSWRSTVITGITLPIALIGSFSAMAVLGFSLNGMTLMAMSLSVGLLIDDAIVVRENIVRHLGMGKSPRQAALDGTHEIGLAVLATTFTLCAVFLPVAFMGGIIGRFFYPFGMVVVCAVLLSMLVSFTVDPMLSSIWHDPAVRRAGAAGTGARLTQRFEHAYEALSRFYQRLVAWSLGHRRSVVAIALLSFVASFALVPLVGTEFVPEADLSELVVHVNTPSGASLEFTEDKVRLAQAAIRELPEVAYTYATVNTGFVVGKNQAVIFVRLHPRSERERSQQALAPILRERLAAIAGLEVTRVGAYAAISGGKLIQISVQGPSIAELDRIAKQVLGVLRDVQGPVDLESSLKTDRPTLEVRLNREAASDLGVGAAQIASVLRPLVAGEEVGFWEAPDSERYDVRVRLAPDERRTQGDLEHLRVIGRQAVAEGGRGMVALSQVAQLAETNRAAQVDRRDQRREVLVTANVAGRASGDVFGDIDARLKDVEVPPGYRLVFGGAREDMDETLGYAVQALVLAVLFIYFILTAQFRDFLQPIAIMLSLPLSLIGVMLALLVTGSTLNIFSVIGFIMLMGLVTKNAILLVDFVNQAMARGVPRAEAIMQSAQVRLRPILMTTAAMVFGMLPLALGLGEGAEQRSPMAHAVIGGVIASTFLTLLVVPVAYTYLDDLSRALRRGTKRDAPANRRVGEANDA